MKSEPRNEKKEHHHFQIILFSINKESYEFVCKQINHIQITTATQFSIMPKNYTEHLKEFLNATTTTKSNNTLNF